MAATAAPAGGVEPSNRLHVRNLDYSVDDATLSEAFAKYGQVREATVVQWRDSGRSRGFGFVTFETDAGAKAAAEELHGADINGRPISVHFARSTGPKTADEFRRVATRLYVTNVNEATTEDDLQAHFGAYGTVTEARLVRSRDTDTPRGFAFVAFASHEEAEKAMQDSQGAPLDGNELSIDWARGAPSRVRGGARGRGRGGRGRRGGRARGGQRREIGADGGAAAIGEPLANGSTPAGTTAGGATAGRPEKTAAPPKPQTRVYVADLNSEVSETDLMSLFQPYGASRVSLEHREARRETDSDRTFAFVTCDTEQHAQDAVHALNGATLGSATIKVELARPKPRRAGGRRGRRRGGRGGGAAGAATAAETSA